MLKKVKTGIVGTGNLVSIANSHLKGYQDNPYTELVGVYDVVYENAVSWVKNKGLQGIRICVSYEELLNMVDAISICTPNFTHPDLAIKAFEAGKHVLCEKPLSISYEDGNRSIAHARDAGVVNMIGFCYRGVPAIRYMKRIIEEGRLGSVYLIRQYMGRDRLADPTIGIEWRMKRDFAGGGALADFGSHMIDLADHLLSGSQGRITEVSGTVNTFIKDRPLNSEHAQRVTNDDCAVFSAKTEDGALLSFATSRLGPSGHTIEITGSGGTILYKEGRGDKLWCKFKDINGGYKNSGEIIEVPGEFISDPWFNDQINRFINGVLTGKSVQPDFERGLYVQYIIDAIERAALEGQWVRI